MIERWLTAIRDDPHRPTPLQVNVLTMLALRMDWKTGTGYVSDRQLSLDADAGRSTVQRATRWGRRAGYLTRTRRGHGTWQGGIAASEWKLSDGPAAPQPVTRDALRSSPQPVTRDALLSDPDAPTRRQRRSHKAPPGSTHQESITSSTRDRSRRTTRNRSRGRATATDDDFDDFSNPEKTLTRWGLSQDQARPALELIARLCREVGVDVGGYLRSKSGSPGEFTGWLTGQLAKQATGADDDEGEGFAW